MTNIPTRLGNPGDLKFAGQQGAIADSSGFAKFSDSSGKPDPVAGMGALLNDLQAKIARNPDGNLADLVKVYAPPSENNSAQYTADLANKLHIRPDAKGKDLQPIIGQLADAISGNEGYGASSSGGIPVTPLGTDKTQSSTGGIPITPLQVPTELQNLQGQSTSLPESPFPLQEVANGNAASGKDRAIGASKGMLQVLNDVAGTSGGNPVVNGMLANAPAFNKNIQSAKDVSVPSNFAQRQGASETKLGANLASGMMGASMGSEAMSGTVPAVKGLVSTAEAFAKAHPVKSAVGAYVIANLLKNTSLGATIEKATGIKGLLDLL